MNTSRLISLRAVEPADLDFIFQVENNMNNWEISNTHVPFSKHHIRKYLENVRDIYADRQLRLVICFNGVQGGLLDFFDFDPYHLRAGVGIFVSEELRKQGIARQAVEMAVEYARDHLGLRNLFCNILAENTASISLFESSAFTCAGTKKCWHRSKDGTWKDELIYQLRLAN